MTRLEEKTSLLTLRSMVAMSMPFFFAGPSGPVTGGEEGVLSVSKETGKDAGPARQEAHAAAEAVVAR